MEIDKIISHLPPNGSIELREIDCLITEGLFPIFKKEKRLVVDGKPTGNYLHEQSEILVLIARPYTTCLNSAAELLRDIAGVGHKWVMDSWENGYSAGIWKGRRFSIYTSMNRIRPTAALALVEACLLFKQEETQTSGVQK